MRNLRIARAGAERLSDIAPLWKALQAHHAALAPTLGGHVARSPEEAWEQRRVKYEAWLREPDTFVLLAERAGQPVGYALVTIGEGPQGWAVGKRVADVQTLSVLSDARSEGCRDPAHGCRGGRIETARVGELRLLVIAPNAEAIRFYERRGLTTVSHVMAGPVRRRPRQSTACVAR